MEHRHVSREIESSLRRNAIRLLFILVAGSEAITNPEKNGPTHIFSGEARLHALDFWVRYPDYLADELLDQYEITKNYSLIEDVRRIFSEDEPDLRKIPMLRYRFGAYEKIDTAMSYLSCRKLVKPRKRQSGDKIQEYDFLIFFDAISLLTRIVREFPQLQWYSHRARLVAQLAGNRGGNALKQHQHQRWDEYHITPMGQAIPSIADRVWIRFQSLEGVAA